MDHIPRDDILWTSVYMYKMIGEQMHYSSKKLTLFRMWNCFVFGVNILVSIISIVHVQAEMYVKSLEGGATALHVSLYVCS